MQNTRDCTLRDGRGGGGQDVCQGETGVQSAAAAQRGAGACESAWALPFWVLEKSWAAPGEGVLWAGNIRGGGDGGVARVGRAAQRCKGGRRRRHKGEGSARGWEREARRQGVGVRGGWER